MSGAAIRWGRALLALLVGGSTAAWAGEAGREPAWSAPHAVYRTDVPLRGPELIADSSGALHLFFAMRRGTAAHRLPDSLMYARRAASGDWSATECVLVDPDDGPLDDPAVALDARGFLHVTYSGTNGVLMYHRVHLSEITQPTAWAVPQRLSGRGVFSSDVLSVGERTLHLAYASRSGDVLYRRSDDGGRNWSAAVQLSAIDPEREASAAPRLAIDRAGHIHAIWSQHALPKGWPPLGGYYSRSEDGGATWSPPEQFVGERFGWGNIAAGPDGSVHIVWDALAVVGDRLHQWSEDGRTWSGPQQVSGRIRGGWTGPPGLAFDSAGTLHLITSVDGPKSVERIFHLTWDGQAWSRPELLSGGTAAIDSVEFPALAIGGGNHLHVAYEGDYRAIWYAERVVDAPAVPPRDVPPRPTDLWSRAADTSIPFRVFAVVLAVLALESSARTAWRAARYARARSA